MLELERGQSSLSESEKWIVNSERDNQSSGLGDSLSVDYGLEELSQQIVERLLARIQDGELHVDDHDHDHYIHNDGTIIDHEDWLRPQGTNRWEAPCSHSRWWSPWDDDHHDASNDVMMLRFKMNNNNDHNDLQVVSPTGDFFLQARSRSKADNDKIISMLITLWWFCCCWYGFN